MNDIVAREIVYERIFEQQHWYWYFYYNLQANIKNIQQYLPPDMEMLSVFEALIIP